MSDLVTTLPDGFQLLEPFVARWSASDLKGRMDQRFHRTAAERLEFYNAAKDLIDPALRYLDQYDLDHLDHSQTNLLNLVLSMTHIALAVERMKDQEEVHAVSRRAIHVSRIDADWPVAARSAPDGHLRLPPEKVANRPVAAHGAFGQFRCGGGAEINTPSHP